MCCDHDKGVFKRSEIGRLFVGKRDSTSGGVANCLSNSCETKVGTFLYILPVFIHQEELDCVKGTGGIDISRTRKTVLLRYQYTPYIKHVWRMAHSFLS